MPKRRDLDTLLRDWPYRPDEVLARIIKGSDGRQIVQMRIDLGILQMELTDRPDGQRPHGEKTYFDYLIRESLDQGDAFTMTPEQCQQADQEFAQFYQRRISWLSLREFRRAVNDADHTLAFMDFVKEHSPDDDWTIGHEQYRPFVLFHRVQASVFAMLDDEGAEAAIAELNRGLTQFKKIYAEYEAEEKYEEDEFVVRLNELKESLRKHFRVDRTLQEQLDEAVAQEQYELAAKLRDKLAKKKKA
jgi:UvrB/uvrC motif